MYSYDDTSGDSSFSDFNINAAPSYVFEVINDIQSINDILKVHILPWSPVSRSDELLRSEDDIDSALAWMA